MRERGEEGRERRGKDRDREIRGRGREGAIELGKDREGGR